MQTLTLKTGSLGHTWHIAHLLLTTLTCGGWAIVYGIHALIHTTNRPAVQVEVPDGHRVEYRNGWPNVLAPDEHLEPRPVREKVLLTVGYALPALVLAAAVFGQAVRS